MRVPFQWLIGGTLLLGAACQVTAHPLQAEPINHPYVYNFDQFYLPQDPDEHLAQGGLLMMAELRCAACHELPEAWKAKLQPAPGPDLSAVGSRLDGDQLWLMVRGPALRKAGTQMPAVFSNAEGDAEKVEALVTYLASLKRETPPMPAGDPARGKTVYHTSGCVACHEPAIDLAPPGHRVGTEVERPGNASVPIALADTYELHALGRYLFDPLKDRPSGRMPSMHLTEQEAADVAAYLHEGRVVETAPQRALLAVPAQTIEAGRKLFTESRCANCHSPQERVPQALPMSQLQPDTATNCLAETPASGAVRYGFNALQRQALGLALKRVQAGPPAAETREEKLDWQMMRMNCYACHDRDGKGGPEDPRMYYFGPPTAENALDPSHGRLPPSLDGAAERLGRAGLEAVLHGKAERKHPHLLVRMPQFGEIHQKTMLETWFSP